jgi:hypothetical protein
MQSCDENTDLLLAAVKQLEARYRHIHSACIALGISGLYRQLSLNSFEHKQHGQWHHLSRLWWQRYCLKRGKSPQTPLPQKSLEFFDQVV